MRRFHNGWTGLTVFVVTAFLLVACQPQSVEQLRRGYSVELNSWYQEDTPGSAEGMISVEEEGDGEDAEATEGEGEDEAPAAEGEAGEEDEATAEIDGPDTLSITSRVTLDILVSHEGAGTLPGVTLDIYQAGPDEEVKRNWKLWVDTSDMALTKQVTQSLEGVDLEEGDQFAVEIRETVPEDERQEYREFAMHGSS